MKLRVSTNWDDSLLDGLAETCTEEVYGKLPFDVIGGVRPAFLLPHVSREEVETHVRYARQVDKLGQIGPVSGVPLAVVAWLYPIQRIRHAMNILPLVDPGVIAKCAYPRCMVKQVSWLWLRDSRAHQGQ